MRGPMKPRAKGGVRGAGRHVMPAKRKQPHLGAAMGKPKGKLKHGTLGTYTEKK